MKVGDMVDHRNGGPRSVLGTGLITRVYRLLNGPTDRVDVLWSNTAMVLAHHTYELRLVEAMAVAEYKAKHAAKNKKRSAN